MLSDQAFIFGLIAVLVNVIGYIPYFYGIFRGTVKPQRVTWGLWTILVSITFVNQVLNGGGYSSYFVGSTALLVAAVFLLSFKYGMGGKSRLDIGSLIAAGVLLALWAITRDTRTTTLIAVGIDAVGAVPTAYKAYVHPETEAYAQWILAGVASIFSMLAVSGNDYILFIYPAYVLIMNAAIVAAKYFGTLRIQRPKEV